MHKKKGGRPKGSGMYGEPTKLFRVPVSFIPHLEYIMAHWTAKKTIRQHFKYVDEDDD
ncbi:MAG: hypothetical protein LBH59_06835 [Planctomycetaceae bacterium]|nr:hypothetical protein [Planctomycetaceae bacterium]